MQITALTGSESDSDTSLDYTISNPSPASAVYRRPARARIRAGTHCPVRFFGGSSVQAVTGDGRVDGRVTAWEFAEMRIGTRCVADDGYDIAVLDRIAAASSVIGDDGLAPEAAECSANVRCNGRRISGYNTTTSLHLLEFLETSTEITFFYCSCF